MPTAATIRSLGRIDDATATRIADHWNAAYPVMREIATARITAYRAQISNKAWQVDPVHPHADVLRAHTLTEAQLVRRLKGVEVLRRDLGQLDRGTHRACTQSPGGFNVLAAFTSVRNLLTVAGLGDRGLAPVYRLAAALAEAADELHREWVASTAAESGSSK
ncbi:hypothetical protein ACH419_39450 [Streptomyces bobili]|uniref:hypothetical protein n=1 Tax=Streptomyces bobili TaxID=67280 RepID=UPI0037AE8CE1